MTLEVGVAVARVGQRVQVELSGSPAPGDASGRGRLLRVLGRITATDDAKREITVALDRDVDGVTSVTLPPQRVTLYEEKV